MGPNLSIIDQMLTEGPHPLNILTQYDVPRGRDTLKISTWAERIASLLFGGGQEGGVAGSPTPIMENDGMCIRMIA